MLKKYMLISVLFANHISQANLHKKIHQVKKNWCDLLLTRQNTYSFIKHPYLLNLV